MYSVKIKFANREDVIIKAKKDDNLLDLLRNAKIPIDTPCSGNGLCGKCRIKVLKGTLDSPKTIYITPEDFENGWRLACRSQITGNLEILVPETASIYKGKLKIADLGSKKELEIFEKLRNNLVKAGMKFTNHFRIVPLEMNPPSLDDTLPDNERLVTYLKKKFNEEIKVGLNFYIIKKLAKILRESNFKVQLIVKVYEKNIYVYDIFKSDEHITVGGLALDIGTTTVAALIIDLLNGKILSKASVGNEQIKFGADVLTRIYESTRPNGREKIQNAIIKETINPLIENLCTEANIKEEEIYELSVSCNTIMNHLFLGINSVPLMHDPHICTFFKAGNVYANDLELKTNPNAKLIISPNVSSFAGGDHSVGVFISMIWNRPEFSVFIDVGTNIEIDLGNKDYLISCATAGSPALEGQNISNGMRAASGAIDKCSIDKETLEPIFNVIGEPGTKPLGICGSGIVDLVAELFRSEAINSKGKFIRKNRRIKYDKEGMGYYIVAFKHEINLEDSIKITEGDISNFIRGKAALFAAISTLLKYCKLTIPSIQHVFVSGGFSSGINVKNAIYIGMLPDIPVNYYEYIGNSSLAGAYAILQSVEAKKKLIDLVSTITYIQLDSIGDFMSEFVKACFLPHTNLDLFPSFKKGQN